MEEMRNIQSYIEEILEKFEQELIEMAECQTEDYIFNLISENEYLSEADIAGERQILDEFFNAEREYLLGKKRKELEG